MQADFVGVCVNFLCFVSETAAWNYFILCKHISLGDLFIVCENREGAPYASLKIMKDFV